MAGGSLSELPRRIAGATLDTWRSLDFEQRVVAVAAVLLIVSTFGPFSFVEGAIIVVSLAILLLLRRRAQGREFHVPFGDGTIIAAAGVWSAVLIIVRLFSRPLGQGLLALACAAILVLAGARERARRPADDLPLERARARDPARGSAVDPGASPAAPQAADEPGGADERGAPSEAPTQALPDSGSQRQPPPAGGSDPGGRAQPGLR